MRAPATGSWAKLSPRHDPEKWHPLADHCHDVAACFEAIIGIATVQRRLAGLADREDLAADWIARLTVLAFLHDYGKANHAFQDRKGGHLREAGYPLLNEDVCVASGLYAVDKWASDPLELFWTILAHHGEAPDAIEAHDSAYSRSWQANERQDPAAEVARLIREARQSWPAAFDPAGAPLPSSPAFWHGFLGLLQLADWLGSDDDAFPFSEDGDPPRREFARQRAGTLVTDIGLEVEQLRHPNTPPPQFSAISPFPPSDIQRAVGEAEGPIVVMESETGSGKTEAALYRFARLFLAGHVDALYFALPTRVAATQMFRRVRECMERLFADPDNRPRPIMAVPGDVGAGDARILPRELPGFHVEWSDDPDEAERRRRWAAERPKRFLAATVAVGTIDQALLGAVRVKHAQMRAACLSRSLLVVDEVHASDTYMTSLLQNLLKQHLRSGGEALLLSASLGGQARAGLMLDHAVGAYSLRRLLPSLEEAVAAPYPAVSSFESGAVVTRAAASRGQSGTVRVEPMTVIGDREAVAHTALDAARAGARVLVIRNTVTDAIETRRALEALAPADAVQFRVGDLPALHHGRFAREDRRLLDLAVESTLGKEAPRDSGLVIVGTQTLEISLDIDADFLISDLAPVDVLLQRIGRLHRHGGRLRPKGFAEARCVVLMPDGFDAALSTLRRDQIGGPHGFGSVYDSLPSLAATQRLIGGGVDWAIPAMNRALVEAATHSEAVERLVNELQVEDPRWREALERIIGKRRAEHHASAGVALAWGEPVSRFRTDERAATRLGARDVEAVFESAAPGPFGRTVPRLVIPQHLNPSGDFNATDVRAVDNGFDFRLGETEFTYDNFGLQRH